MIISFEAMFRAALQQFPPSSAHREQNPKYFPVKFPTICEWCKNCGMQEGENYMTLEQRKIGLSSILHFLEVFCFWKRRNTPS